MLRCSGTNRDPRWVTMMISCQSDLLPPTQAPRPVLPPPPQANRPFCQTVRTVSQAGTAHPGLKSVPCKKLRAAGCSRNESVWRSRKMDPSPHQASSWSAVPGGLWQGAVGLDGPPWDPQKRKKSLDPVACHLVRGAAERRILNSQGNLLGFTRDILRRMVSRKTFCP